MQLKATWVIYMITGISVLLFSCKKKTVDAPVRGEFNYINNQADTVDIYRKTYSDGPVQTYHINPGDTLKLYVNSDGAPAMKPEDYPPGLQSDSLGVVMYDTLCYVEASRWGSF